MSFRDWMKSEDWTGMELDKDLVGDGKVYSPSNCVFVSESVNSFITDRSTCRGLYPIGVHLHSSGKFVAQVNNKKPKYLGLFSTPSGAFSAWLSAKSKLGLTLANEQKDPRVKSGLIQYVKSLPEKYGKFHFDCASN